MDTDGYKRRLLDLEARLSRDIAEERESARAQVSGDPTDVADDGVIDEGESESYGEADLDADVLSQVREALRRIENGTFGRCAVDGGPIEAERLQAIPWTQYCIKHQQQRESADPVPRPTL